MENQKNEIIYADESGNKHMVTIEGGTIKFGGLKYSLAALENLLTMVDPVEFSQSINSLVYGIAQITSEAIRNGGNIQSMIPTSGEFYYAKFLAESFAELGVK